MTVEGVSAWDFFCCQLHGVSINVTGRGFMIHAKKKHSESRKPCSHFLIRINSIPRKSTSLPRRLDIALKVRMLFRDPWPGNSACQLTTQRSMVFLCIVKWKRHQMNLLHLRLFLGNFGSRNSSVLRIQSGRHPWWSLFQLEESYLVWSVQSTSMQRSWTNLNPFFGSSGSMPVASRRMSNYIWPTAVSSKIR